VNPFRNLLRMSSKHTPIGTWIMSGSPLVAEAVGHAGFDWGLVDMEHAPVDMMDVLHMLQAVGNTKMVPVVRVPANDAVMVKRVLDAGATTVMFPFVQTVDEAMRAVTSTRYPPQGTRGISTISRASRFSTDADYLATANSGIAVIVQLETAQALERADAIAAVPGVDALFIGPADLAASMGHPGDLLHPAVVEAMAQAASRIKSTGRPVGTLGASPEAVVTYRAAGFDFIAVMSDMGLLMRGGQEAIRLLRGGAGHPMVHTLADGTRTDTAS
jgi:2-keto-3-deoxy-L-rhamnonate aldolase RhmA